MDHDPGNTVLQDRLNFIGTLGLLPASVDLLTALSHERPPDNTIRGEDDEPTPETAIVDQRDDQLYPAIRVDTSS